MKDCFLKFNEDIKIAICMATYNGQEYLCEQIDSILAQDNEKWVLFIRDDDSVDSTSEIISFYARKYPNRIKRVTDNFSAHSPKDNFGYALKYAREIGCFDYYMFADQDDVWESDKISITLTAMTAAEQDEDSPVLVHTDLAVVDSVLNPIAQSYWKYRSINPNVKETKRLLAQNNVTGCTMMWNRALDSLLAFNTPGIIMHDWWTALIASCFGKIIAVPFSTIRYRQHANNNVGASEVNSMSYVVSRMRNKERYRNITRMSFHQARILSLQYGSNLTDKRRYEIERYSEIGNRGPLARRIAILEGGYLKQGIVQIIGQLLYV